MMRGTTPVHTFELPFDTELVSCARVVYAQDEEVVLIKEHDDCILEGNTVTVHLTQADTLKFNCRKAAQVQVRIKTTAGEVLASQVERLPVDRCLDGEVL